MRRKVLRGALGGPPKEWPPGDTKTTLVADLEAKPQSENRDQIIAMARRGVFHDFDTELDTPKVALYRMLLEFGYPDLAEKVKEGAYDAESATVLQVEEMRQQLGPEIFDAVMGPTKGRGTS